jgi:hypothetical protein
MGHGPSTFRQSDVARVLRAAQAAGVRVRIEIEWSKMIVTMLAADGDISAPNDDDDTPEKLVDLLK